MSRAVPHARILVRMAWLNLFNHKAKNIAVGLLMAFGTFLVVVGTSTLESIEGAMTRSVTGSIAGHLQVYDADARDELALFGGGFMGVPDIGQMPDFRRVKDTVLAVDNVRAVVPMGIDFAEFYTATELDLALEALRTALKNNDEARIGRAQQKVRAMATLLREEYDNRKGVAADVSEVEAKLADVDRVLSDDFWRELRADPVTGTTFLDTRLAPLVEETDAIGLNYIGTDIDAFMANFDRFELVRGERVPPGAHGLLVNQHFYDQVAKNKVARMFDDLKKALREDSKTLAGDPLLQSKAKQMVRQYRRVTFALEPEAAEALEVELRELFPDPRGNLDALMQALLTVDDGNFDSRHAFFQAQVVPRIKLYLFDIGDVITMRSYTRPGYLKSVNIRVYGTFTFRGLEESALAGVYSIIDLMSFRELYGVMSAEKRAELAAIKAEVGLADIRVEDAEDALFGGGATPSSALRTSSSATLPDPLAVLERPEPSASTKPTERDEQPFSQAQIDNGMALNAAILLHDPKSLLETQQRVQASVDKAELGLKVVDWRAATGIVGQFVSLAGLVLFVSISIIFVVAIVIMNNTMVMATSERATEIGTMRAIGSTRSFILVLFLLETLMLGGVAGIIGASSGFAMMSALASSGIPAPSDELIFLFSGPRLYPVVSAEHVVTALVLILVVSLVATLYPALLATRIQPVVAMTARE